MSALSFFTIITATYNAANTLPKLLDSLASQTCKDFELVVQDGASQDNTAAIVEGYRHKIPHISYASEPDTGIYHAWNTALKRIQGKWVLFLGADDVLFDETTLATAKERIRALPSTLLFAVGSAQMVAEKECLNLIHGQSEMAVELLARGIMPGCHTVMFHNASLFTTSAFNPAYAIAGDYDFLCRNWKCNNVGANLDITVALMAAQGVSSSPFHALTMRQEYCKSLWQNYPLSWSHVRWLQILAKSLVLQAVCLIFGSKAPKVLDSMRALRGLPKAWEKQVKP